MGRKLALFVSAVLAAGLMTGCGGRKYTAGDGSFSIVLPGGQWEDDETTVNGLNMYMFSLSATSDSALETGFEDEAVIMYANIDGETAGTLDYDSVPTTEEELMNLMGSESGCEILSFEGKTDKIGVKSCLCSLRIPSGSDDSDEDDYYMVMRTSMSEDGGYFASGMVYRNDQELFEDVEESVKSITVNNN